MDLFQQALWAFVLWYCAFVNFDAFRFKKMPMRLVGFIASMIAALYAAGASMQLVEMLEGYEPERIIGVEVLISIGLAVWFLYPHGEVNERRRRAGLPAG